MKISLYQISYNEEVMRRRDPGLGILDVREDPSPDRREVHHMWRFWQAGHHDKADYTGLLSPKFPQKTGMTSGDIVRYIELHPGYDVYFFNPYPQHPYWMFNVWNHGEVFHPGLQRLADTIFQAAGHKFRTEDLPRNGPDTLLFCNYWVGSAKFWNEYMTFVDGLIRAIDSNPALANAALSSALYPEPATFFPFFFERTFSAFLTLRRDLKAKAFTYSRAEIRGRNLTDIEKIIIYQWGDMIDEWDASGVFGPDRRRFLCGLPLFNIAYVNACNNFARRLKDALATEKSAEMAATDRIATSLPAA
ncbi:hypothetical protein [Mongoliimonas terrestris]|uniref:hypothetical protein n=1 Tax=Mongoliimonas terrestris TaxID=1709001 RepID=UPI000949940F|nr:hypothetical protein [Mongoliimonas terrestris]